MEKEVTLHILISHPLSDIQRDQAGQQFGILDFRIPPEPLLAKWRSVPPEIDSLRSYASPFLSWLSEANTGYYAMIQGEFGMTRRLTDFCFKHDLIPIYATTQRNVVEKKLPDGRTETRRTFSHIRFRKYEQL